MRKELKDTKIEQKEFEIGLNDNANNNSVEMIDIIDYLMKMSKDIIICHKIARK